MKTTFTSISRFFVIVILFVSLSGCIVVDIGGAGAFKKPLIHDANHTRVYIDIPPGIFDEKEAKFFGEKDGSKISFGYLGSCGGGLTLSGIMIPFFPSPHLNNCVEKGFYVAGKLITDILGVTLQLRYNSTTYDPYIENGSVKFRISDFSAFKKASDKTLIIHKKRPDGSIFTKELPFDWKIVVEVMGGL